ncbi:MAG: hypothetical protein WAW41_00010 [Methylobacter sp.]
MALNLKVLDLIEDVDPTTRQPRLRARVQELTPRTHFVNLKNCDAAQISVIKANKGGVLSIPAREMMMDGRFMISIAATDEEFFVIRPPETVAVSKVVELEPNSSAIDSANPANSSLTPRQRAQGS